MHAQNVTLIDLFGYFLFHPHEVVTMLVLSRKPTESLELPDLGVQIRILRCTPSQVQIGIDAPRSIRVIRGELSCDDIRSLPDQLDAVHSQRLLARLESQVCALAEMSAASDRDLASSVAEEATATLQQLRRQLSGAARTKPPIRSLRAGAIAADAAVPSSCVRQTESGYAISHLATSA